MTPELLGLIITGVLGSGGVAAFAGALVTRRKTDAEALAVLAPVWHAEIARLTDRIDGLEIALADERRRRRVLEALLIEHRIDLPPS